MGKSKVICHHERSEVISYLAETKDCFGRSLPSAGKLPRNDKMSLSWNGNRIETDNN